MIDGCHAGIGLAVIRALAGAGANVAMHGLGDKKYIQKMVDELKAEHGVEVGAPNCGSKMAPYSITQ